MRTITLVASSLMLLVSCYGNANESFTPYWPEGFDGTDNFLEHHRLIHETPKAKIVDVYIPAKTAEQPHTHMLNSYMFIDQPTKIAVRLVDEQGNENLVFQSSETETVSTETEVFNVQPEPFHYVTNIDDKDFRAIRVEIKHDIETAKSYIDWTRDPDLKEIIPNTIWKMPLTRGGISFKLKDEDMILIGNRNTKIEVFNADNKGLKPINRIQFSSDRPPVWYLHAGRQYLIGSTEKDSVYYLPLR